MVTHSTDGQCPSVQVLDLVPIFYRCLRLDGNVAEAGFKLGVVGTIVDAGKMCELYACRRSCSPLLVMIDWTLCDSNVSLL